MSRNGRPGWNAGRRMDLAVLVLNREEAHRDEVKMSSAPDRRPAQLPLADVVAEGRAAYCWLDVVVSLRSVTRHQEWGTGASTGPEPRH